MSCLYLTGRPCINSFSVVFCFQTAPSIKTLEAHGIQKDVKDIAISNKYIKEVNKFLCGYLLSLDQFGWRGFFEFGVYLDEDGTIFSLGSWILEFV